MMICMISMTVLIASCSDDEDPASPALRVTSITPTSGQTGTEVTINGKGFSTTAAENSVKLNGKTCPVTSATAIQLKVTIPADATSGKLQVTVNGKTVETPAFTVTVDDPELTITSIDPTTGPKATIVTITGTGFSSTAASNTVTLNDKPVSVNGASATQLTVTIPSGAGSGPLVITVDGTTVESAHFTFVYTATVSTFAGSTNGYTEGTGTAAQFSSPFSVAVDGSDNVYLSDHGNHKIRKITPAGVTSLVSGSTEGDLLGTGAEAQFRYPYNVATDATGNVYVVDTHNHKIKKTTSGGLVTLFAGSTGGGADGTGAEAQFYYPTGIAIAADGTMYIADKDNHTIRKITSAGAVTTLAGQAGQSGYADATGPDARFNGPYDLTIGSDGNIYVADASNHKIRKVTPAGVVTTVAGSTGGFMDGAAEQAQFNYPYSVVAGAGNVLYVVDTHNHKIRKIDTDGTVSTVAGTTGGSDDGGVATAKFYYPTDMVIDSEGNFYIADKDNHRIRKVVLD
jgi:sugar lactone lactonase YvrE